MPGAHIGWTSPPIPVRPIDPCLYAPSNATLRFAQTFAKTGYSCTRVSGQSRKQYFQLMVRSKVYTVLLSDAFSCVLEWEDGNARQIIHLGKFFLVYCLSSLSSDHFAIRELDGPGLPVADIIHVATQVHSTGDSRPRDWFYRPGTYATFPFFLVDPHSQASTAKIPWTRHRIWSCGWQILPTILLYDGLHHLTLKVQIQSCFILHSPSKHLDIRVPQGRCTAPVVSRFPHHYNINDEPAMNMAGA